MGNFAQFITNLWRDWSSSKKNKFQLLGLLHRNGFRRPLLYYEGWSVEGTNGLIFDNFSE
jgi:hypothetical protein